MKTTEQAAVQSELQDVAQSVAAKEEDHTTVKAIAKKNKQDKNGNHDRTNELPYRLKYSIGMKTIAFFTFLLMVLGVCGYAVAIKTMLENNFYNSTEQAIKEKQFEQIASGYLPELIVLSQQEDADTLLTAYCIQNNIAVQMIDAGGNVLLHVDGVLEDEGSTVYDWSFTYPSSLISTSIYGEADGTLISALRDVNATIVISFTPDGSWENALSAEDNLITYGYENRYFSVINFFLCAVLGVLLLCYLVSAVGHSPRGGQVVLTRWAKIPFDGFGLLSVAVLCVPLMLAEELRYQGSYLAWWQIAVLQLGAIAAVVAIVVLFLLNVAVRCKTGMLWRNTIVYRVLAFVFRLLKKAARQLAAALGQLFAQLPFIWKGVVLLPALVLVNLILLWVCVVPLHWAGALYLFLTGVQVLCIMGGYLYFLLALNRLAAGGRALATGDLTYQVDTKHLYFELKEHAENINQMRSCLNQAVNERMKSERMKTELITNVSHDIKTPLTSIINYTDLLSKEPTDNANIAEYTLVITRQSERLKRLIEDLVEASKASTGNLEVTLLPCDIGVMLSQAVGEYQQRLAAQSLTLVVKQPETPLTILADGRHLWRVFDNLLGNIDKYAQQGTRVYLDLAQVGGQVVLTFKNISKYPLDISAEELMERFVRGDASRHNEGNGLGLSIAQSLTELQGGSLTLHVDGDLFKVTLTFALLEPPVA